MEARSRFGGEEDSDDDLEYEQDYFKKMVPPDQVDQDQDQDQDQQHSKQPRQPLTWKWSQDCSSVPTELLVIGLSDVGIQALHAVYPQKKLIAKLEISTSLKLASKTELPGIPVICELYAIEDASTVQLLLCKAKIPIDRSYEWASLLFQHVQARTIIVLDSLQLVNYVTNRDPEVELAPPLLRALHTSAAGFDAPCSFLESPNLVQGASAAALAHYQIRNAPGRLYLSLVENFNGRGEVSLASLLAFERVLVGLPLAVKHRLPELLQIQFQAYIKRNAKIQHNPLYL